MPYIDIEDLIRKQRKSEIDYEVKLRNTGWGDVMDELEDMPHEKRREAEKTCGVCGETFPAKRKWALFCSGKCQRLSYSGAEHNGEIMSKIEKFALVYLECNRDIVKVTKAMGYKDISYSRRALTRAKGEGLL